MSFSATIASSSTEFTPLELSYTDRRAFIMTNSIYEEREKQKERGKERVKITGEVFTPLVLAKRMVRALPAHFLESSETSFLDHSAGDGNFLIALVEVLTEEYGHSQESVLSRVYAVDLMPDNVQELKKRLGVTEDHPNFVCHDSLSFDFSTFRSHFDVIVGNPPFQGVGKKAAKLWPRFVELTTTLLRDGGASFLITPSTWLNRRPTGAWRHFSKVDIIELWTDVDSFFPGVCSTFSATLFLKEKPTNTTLVNGAFELNLHTDDFPPDAKNITLDNLNFIKWATERRLILDVKLGSCPLISEDSMSETRTEIHSHEVYYTSAANRRSVWCDHACPGEGELKLIVGHYGNVFRTPEISLKGVGRKGKFVLGDHEFLEFVLSAIRLPESRRWTELMTTDAFIEPLTFVVDPRLVGH